MMPLGPYYYNTYAWSKPLTFQDLAATIKQEPEGLPPGETVTLSGQTSSPSQLRGQTKDVIFFDEVQESPKKSHQDEFLEAMGGKKIENPCGEIDISPYIQIDKRIDHEWGVIDRVTQIAKQEMQAAEDVRVFKMMDAITNPHIDEIEKANEIMNQKTKEAEKIIQNPDYMVVKRNKPTIEEFVATNKFFAHNPTNYMFEDVIAADKIIEWTRMNTEPVEVYGGTWNTEYLELPKSEQDKRSKEAEDKKNLFDSKGEINATSLKDALQTLIKYAKILEKEEAKDVEALQTMQDKFVGGDALKHPVENNVFIEPSYVTNGADPAAKVKQIISSSISDKERDELLIKALNSAEGKKALAMSMAEPIRRNLDYHEIARRALPIEQMKLPPTRGKTTMADVLENYAKDNKSSKTIVSVLEDKKKRRRRKIAPVNPLFLFTLAAAGAGMAHATKSKVSNEDIKVRQINS